MATTSFENILKDAFTTKVAAPEGGSSELTLADHSGVSIHQHSNNWAHDIQTTSGGTESAESANRKDFGEHKKCEKCPMSLECMSGTADRSWQLPTKFSEVKEAVRLFCIEKGQVKLIPAPYQASAVEALESMRAQVTATKGNHEWLGNMGGAPYQPDPNGILYTTTIAVGGMVGETKTAESTANIKTSLTTDMMNLSTTMTELLDGA
jgi:hypothetical protein